jgi:hypothetical protein
MPAETAQAAPAVRALTSPSCGCNVTLRAAGYSVTIACLYCGSLLDVTDPEVKLITEYRQAAAELAIPLGSRGVLKGVEWEAIGYLERSENGYYPWSEYLLFNPYHGYRWLITDGRGWSFGTMLTAPPFNRDVTQFVENEAYEPFFADSESQVDYVLGEFYWRVAVGEKVATADWVRPGWMLSRESNENEESWTVSELLAPEEMRSAFGVEPPQSPWPPLPHQPPPFAGEASRMTKIGGGTGVFLFLLFLLIGGGPRLAETILPFTVGAGERTATVGPLTLTRPWQFVSIRARVPTLDNSWLDLDYALVDRKSQQSFEAYGVAERYSGRDSDGPWTEGSRGSTVKIAAVPRGTYDLVVDYSGTRWSSPSSGSSWSGYGYGSGYEAPQQAELVISTGGFFGSNLLLALALLLIPLAILAYRYIKFEQARQDQSDFGRSGAAKLFTSDEDEDDDE